MRLALDTNRYTDLCNGDPEVVDHLQVADTIYLPFVVLAELRAGFAVGIHGRTNENSLNRFLAKPGVETIFATEKTTWIYTDLFRQLRRQGTPIPTNDLWISSLVIEHNLVLYSRDDHFRHLPQLNILT